MRTTEHTSEWGRLLEDNAGIIYKLSFLYTNSKEEAEDLRQEISYQLVKSFARFKGESKVSTWVYKVALFTALSHLKEAKKTPVLEYAVPEKAVEEQPDERWPEVLEAIKTLPALDKSLLFLYLENKTYAEMAVIMGLTESNIGVRLNRIKKKLKEKLN